MKKNIVNRIYFNIKKNGLAATTRKIINKIADNDNVSNIVPSDLAILKKDILDKFSFVIDTKHVDFSKEDYDNNKNSRCTLNWIIPEVGIGSGGHINIFRFIKMLADKGICNWVYIYNPASEHDELSLKEFVEKYYGVVSSNIRFGTDIENMSFAHGVVCTSWQTAYFAKNFNNTLAKFYFVQDYEPYFYSMGSEYFLAENTYKMGFFGITAGYWLQDKLKQEYGMDTKGYLFSYDKKLYTCKEKKDKVKRVFFYFRPSTERRLTEIGIIALTQLSNCIKDIEIWFAGAETNEFDIPFKFKNLGILKLEQLCDVYSQCDMCLVLSATNLSLLPLEIMASNSVVVSNGGVNNSWLLNENNSIMASNDPIDIADKMIYYFNHYDELQRIRENGKSFAESTSWKKSGDIVYEAIMAKLNNVKNNV